MINVSASTSEKQLEFKLSELQQNELRMLEISYERTLNKCTNLDTVCFKMFLVNDL